ncbi:MAG TPA: DnaB-like helicase C-terminal domain-containing protein, partial [Alphaproteobacteria bacterium]|nr:DnaB-like helicase C-terminal domain-containing protein [Alphaproteobacteria bacterium]
MTEEEHLARLVNCEIEQSLLGCLLLEPKCFDSVAWFSEAFLGIAVHGKIFDAIKTHRMQGRDYCPEMIAQYFSADEDLAEVGGGQYLKDLAANVISPQNVRGYANFLLSLHYRRMALTVGKSMKELAINADLTTPPEVLLTSLDLLLADARNLKTRDNIKTAPEGITAALELAKNPTHGVNSGFGKLQKITGGFKPSELITIGGRPGMGKTAMALTLAVNAAKSGKHVLFFSLEMSHQQLWQRILSRLSRAPLHSGNLHDEEWEDVEQAAVCANTLPLDIDDSPGLTALEICARAAQYKRKNGLDLIIIDYLGFIKASDPKANKVHQIEEIT